MTEKTFYTDDAGRDWPIEDMQEAIDRAAVFFNDVMPQAGRLAFQDYANLNELAILLGKLSDRKDVRYV